jgi:hypothetical protein
MPAIEEAFRVFVVPKSNSAGSIIVQRASLASLARASFSPRETGIYAMGSGKSDLRLDQEKVRICGLIPHFVLQTSE